MGYKQLPMDPEQARAEITVPTYMIKLAPGYDGKHRVADLVRTQITDVTVKGSEATLKWTQDFQGNAIPVVMTLTMKDGALTVKQDIAGGQFTSNGTGKKKG